MNLKSLFLFSLYSISLYPSIQNRDFMQEELYEVSKPFYEGYLQVSDLHKIFYAQFGNPNGIPVVIVHGGPGSGCKDQLSIFFDMESFHVIMFDQRGAMRSEPFGEMFDNTPQASVTDMEKLRKHLNIDKWVLFGGSYGSLLSILYGQTHPERVLGFVLRGVVLGRKKDHENIIFDMKRFFPEAWHAMTNLLTPVEQANLIPSMYNRVMNQNPEIHRPISQAFMFYDILGGRLHANPDMIKQEPVDEKHNLSVTRAFIHYSMHNFFLEDNQLLKNMHKISHLPAIILHGRYDLICLPENSFDLYKCWKNSQLWYLPNAGHFANEPSMSRGLKVAMQEMKNILNFTCWRYRKIEANSF